MRKTERHNGRKTARQKDRKSEGKKTQKHIIKNAVII